MATHMTSVSTEGSTAGASSGDIQAVSRTAQILALFGPEHPTLTVAAGATLLGLNRTTTNRYFISMEAAGLLERNPDAPTSFQPSRLLNQLGAFALGRQRVTEIAPPVMRELAAESQLTVAMTLWGTAGPVVVHIEEHQTWGAQVTVRVGSQLPLDAAQALVFMAFHPDRLMVERLMSGVSGGQRRDLETRMEKIRSGAMGQRVALSGVSIFAAPVFDARGICATVALIGTVEKLPVEGSAREHAMLTRTAQRITDLMGGTWPAPLDADVREDGTA